MVFPKAQLKYCKSGTTFNHRHHVWGPIPSHQFENAHQRLQDVRQCWFGDAFGRVDRDFRIVSFVDDGRVATDEIAALQYA